MARQVFPPNVVVKIITGAFFEYRHMKPAPRNLAPGGVIPEFDDDRIISDMEQFGYVRIDALRDTPRGKRDWVVVLVLSNTGRFANHIPDFRSLLGGINSPSNTMSERLDEIIVVAEEKFFTKKILMDVIRNMQSSQVGGADLDGKSPFYNVYHYYNFAHVVPENKSVQPHSIMSVEESKQFLAAEYLYRENLPTIFTTDAPIIWNGGREGQIVKITRDSQTAGTAIYYRRIVRG
jgi:DNA-directed RNA polymerase subunit H